MSSELVRIEAQSITVGAQWKQATDVAGVVRDFALKRVLTIQGRKYPPVEVWQAIANAFGCVASARNVTRVEGGFSAIGEVRRMSDGAVIAEAEGFLGDDEATWSKRPEFARRAMAQTRSISRACRSAFAFVIPLIDAGLQTTPAEEMEALGDVVEHKPVQTATRSDRLKDQLRKPATTEPQEPPHSAETVDTVTGEIRQRPATSSMSPKFGSAKGAPIADFDDKQLAWYLKAGEESVAKNDPKWHTKNVQWLGALKAELAFRRNGSH